MKSIQKDIPSIAGLVATTSLAVITGGLANPVLTNVGASLAANFLTGFTPTRIKKWFVDIHPDDLNNHIKKLFVQSVSDALGKISILFSETQASDKEKTQAKILVKTLHQYLPDMFLFSKQIRLEELEVKKILYEKDKEKMICQFVENQFDKFGITDPFKSFLAKNLPSQIQLCFGENLKDPANQSAWIAFQRMLLEEIRNDVKKITETQNTIVKKFDAIPQVIIINSADYNDIVNEIQKLQELYQTSSDNHRFRISEMLSKKQHQLESLQDNICRLYETFNNISLNSKRLRRAKALFDAGKFREADVLLDSNEIDKEVKLLKKERKKIDKINSDLRDKANELLTKAQIWSTFYSEPNWYDKALNYYLKALQASRIFYTGVNDTWYMKEYFRFESEQRELKQTIEMLKYHSKQAKKCPDTYCGISGLMIQVAIIYLEDFPNKKLSLRYAKGAIRYIKKKLTITPEEREDIETAKKIIEAWNTKTTQRPQISSETFLYEYKPNHRKGRYREIMAGYDENGDIQLSVIKEKHYGY